MIKGRNKLPGRTMGATLIAFSGLAIRVFEAGPMQLTADRH